MGIYFDRIYEEILFFCFFLFSGKLVFVNIKKMYGAKNFWTGISC